jgi:hypothetical protein
MIQENHQPDDITGFADEYDRVCRGVAPPKRMPKRLSKADVRQNRQGRESQLREDDHVSIEDRVHEVVTRQTEELADFVESLFLDYQESSERQMSAAMQLLSYILRRVSSHETLLDELLAHLVSAARRGKTTTCAGDCESVMSTTPDGVTASELVVSGTGAESGSHAVPPGTDCPADPRLPQLMRAVSEGKVRATVVGIRKYLGCAQETAAQLRRALLAQRTYRVLKEREV